MSFMWDYSDFSFFAMELRLLVIAIVFLVCSAHADTCTTPNGKPGQCQRITDCGFLLDLALKSELTKYEVNLLRRSACGFEGSTPKVCCPDVWDVQKCKLSAVPPDPRSRCCGVSYSNDLVKNGKVKEVEIFPWVGKVEFQREIKGKFRNAVIISGRYAVSVAQCFTQSFTRQFGRPTVVRFKAHRSPDCVDDGSGVNCHEGTFSIGIENVLSHKDYNEKEKINDIALIRFAEDAPYTDYIRPLCIPSLDITATGNKDITTITAGWGPVDGKLENPVMRNFYAPYLESKVCAAISSNITNTTISLGDNQICAIVRERYHCRMDTGEPLVYYNENYAEFLGIGSYPLCKGSPDVFTKIYNYRSWILSNIKK